MSQSHLGNSIATLVLFSLLLVARIGNADDGIQRAGAGTDVVFAPLDLEFSATAMEMSEDGGLLAITHQGDNLITVYDVVNGAVTAEIECPAPRSVVFRGNQIIVASRIEGMIRFYQSRGDDWKQTREWRVPKTGVVHISAPSENFFKGELIVTCHGDGRQASYQDSQILVTNSGGRFTPISKSSLGTVSYDGKLFIRHESYNLSSGGQVTAHLMNEYLRSGGKSREVMSGNPDANTFLYQVDKGGYWIGRDCVMGGIPLTRLSGDWGNLILADRTQKMLYVIADDVMTAKQLSAASRSLGVRRIKYPEPYEKMDNLRHGWAHRRDYLLDHPEAATHGDKTSLFIRTAEGGLVLAAVIDSFSGSLGASGTSRSSGKQGTKEKQAASEPTVAFGTPANAKPRTWRSRNGNFSLVATLLRPSGDQVVLKRADNGEEIEVPFASLSDADNRYLERQQAQAAAMP